MNYGQVDIRDPRAQIPNSARVLFDDWMRDPHVCAAPDGCYYLTGTTREPDSPDGKAGMWSDGLRVWRSRDLRAWEPLGIVWSLDHDGQWWGCVFNPPAKTGGPYCALPECRPAIVPMRWDGDRILPVA